MTLTWRVSLKKKLRKIILLLAPLAGWQLQKRDLYRDTETFRVLHTEKDRIREILRNIYRDASGKYFKVLLAQL